MPNPGEKNVRALCVWELIDQKDDDPFMNYTVFSEKETAALRKKIAEGKKEEK